MYVFYHFPCNDGELAKIIWSIKYPLSIFIKWNHMDKEKSIIALNNITEPSDIIFLDVCPDCILPKIHSYLIIDHHMNAINTMTQLIDKINASSTDKLNITMFCDTNLSGCMLTWKYFNSNASYPLVVHHIGNKDIWNFSDINTEPYSIGYNNYLKEHEYNREFIIKSLLISPTTFLHNYMIEDGIKIIVDKIMLAEQYFTEKVFSIETLDNTSYNILDIKCNDSTMFKYLIDYAAAEYTSVDILRIQHTVTSNKIVYSLRSLKEHVLVDGIARKYGGNGHPKAAGYTILSYDETSQMVSL